jgi:hypothetical protein
MRITSFAPSMPRPTYAVSSAPQGTFGATTPVARLVAPAAAETQRSGWVSVRGVLGAGKKVFTGLTLSSLLAVAGCGDQEAAKFAKSLVTNSANSAEAALVRNFPTSNGLGFTGSDTIATVLGGLTPKAGDTVTGGGSTLVDSVVKEVLNPTLPACELPDKIPSNVENRLDWSGIGVKKRGECLDRWEITNPKDPQLPLLRETQQQQEATVVAIESPNGGPCATSRIDQLYNKSKGLLATGNLTEETRDNLETMISLRDMAEALPGGCVLLQSYDERLARVPDSTLGHNLREIVNSSISLVGQNPTDETLTDALKGGKGLDFVFQAPPKNTSPFSF